MKIRWQSVNSIGKCTEEKRDRPFFLLLTAGWSQLCGHFLKELEGNEKLVSFINSELNTAVIDMDERPDIFARFNVGALPSVALLTPNLQLMWATTYMPVAELDAGLRRYCRTFAERKDDVMRNVVEREAKVAEINDNFFKGKRAVDIDIFQRTVKAITLDFDPNNGGFGGQPKLLMPYSLAVILRAHNDTGGKDFEDILKTTFEAYLTKGMFDAKSGTFHRACVDAAMRQPINERLSNENAAILSVLAEIDKRFFSGANADKLRNLTRRFLQVFRDDSTGLFALSDGERRFYKDVNCEIGCSLIRLASTLEMPELTGIAGAIAASSAGKAHNLAVQNSVRVLRDEVWLLNLQVLLAKSGSTRAAEATALGRAIQERFYKDELCGLSDVAALDRDSGISFYVKDMEDNGVFAGCMLGLYEQTGKREFMDSASQILANFPDQGAGYGHWTCHYALAAREYLSRLNPTGMGQAGVR